MLRLLKSGECSNLEEAAQALGYSWRQCQRWFASYREGGLGELLKNRVDERGRQELVTPEALEELQEAMIKGRDRHDLSGSRVLERARHRVFPPRRCRSASDAAQGEAQDGAASPLEKADPQEQEAFKKTSPVG
jgi:hypothetical protein